MIFRLDCGGTPQLSYGVQSFGLAPHSYWFFLIA